MERTKVIGTQIRSEEEMMHESARISIGKALMATLRLKMVPSAHQREPTTQAAILTLDRKRVL